MSVSVSVAYSFGVRRGDKEGKDLEVLLIIRHEGKRERERETFGVREKDSSSF